MLGRTTILQIEHLDRLPLQGFVASSCLGNASGSSALNLLNIALERNPGSGQLALSDSIGLQRIRQGRLDELPQLLVDGLLTLADRSNKGLHFLQ